ERDIFSFTFAIMTCVIFFFGLTRYINFKRFNINSELYDREDTKFSQYFFTSWDWSVKARNTYIDKKSRLRELYRLAMKEAEIVESNNVESRCTVYTIRFVSFLLTFI